jgi:hypothetical protein
MPGPMMGVETDYYPSPRCPLTKFCILAEI